MGDLLCDQSIVQDVFQVELGFHVKDYLTNVSRVQRRHAVAGNVPKVSKGNIQVLRRSTVLLRRKLLGSELRCATQESQTLTQCRQRRILQRHGTFVTEARRSNSSELAPFE